jgi:hypothetical protein
MTTDNSVEIENIENIDNTTTDDVVDGNFLIKVLMNQILNFEEKNPGVQHNGAFPHALKRADAWVKEPNGSQVSTVDQLIELFGLIGAEQIEHEAGYSGPDHNDVYVLRVTLPQDYAVSVTQVMAKHIPRKYSRGGGIVLKELTPKNGAVKGAFALHCDGMRPVNTREAQEEIPSKVFGVYHSVTLKIRKDGHRLVSWLPGLDNQRTPCARLGELFVLLGQPNDDNKHKPKQYQSKGNNPVIRLSQLL